MALEKLKSVFSNTEKFNKTDLTKFNSKFDDVVLLDVTPNKTTQTTNIFDLTSDKTTQTANIFGLTPNKTTERTNLFDLTSDKTTQTTNAFTQPPFDKSTHISDTFVNTNLTTFNSAFDNFDNQPFGGEYIRTPFNTATNFLNTTGLINFTGIANKRNPGPNLWPDKTIPTNTSVTTSGTYTPIITQNTSDTAGEYFSPGGDLGLRLGKNTTWSTLYTKDHTKKPINFDADGERSVNPFQPFSYGNPNIASTFGMGDSLGHSPPTSGFARSGGLLGIPNEPYIISNILTTDSQGGRDINKASRFFPANRATTDTKRIGNFLGSDAGLAFILSSNLQLIVPRTVVRIGDELKKVPQRFNNGYNPLATLLAVSPIARLLGQAQPIISLKSGFNMSPKLPFVPGFLNFDNYSDGSTVSHKLNNTFTGANPPEKGNGNFFQQLLSKAQDYLTGVHSQTYKGVGDKMTLAPIVSGKNTEEVFKEQGQFTSAKDFEKKQHGMPFYFKDLRNNRYIIFRAYLEGISENIAPSWAETNYMGRSEPVYTYERATRDISFTLKLMAQTSDELQSIYTKMNRLTSLCYPEYAVDDLLESKNRMKPPLTKFRMGELFGEQDSELLGFIKSLSYVVPEESTWEIVEKARVPKFVMVSITYQVIHRTPPDIKTRFYGYGEPYVPVPETEKN